MRAYQTKLTDNPHGTGVVIAKKQDRKTESKNKNRDKTRPLMGQTN